jgi:acetylornithine deacetylase/succinyl-diaminopimelate desuccinylase-like protein
VNGQAGARLVEAYLRKNSGRHIKELCQFLRIPSVSADPRRKADVQRAAQFVRRQLAAAGLRTRLYPTKGHPIVVGEWLKAPECPTVLIYGHYDVQPPDPLDKWVTGPFEPTIRKGRLYARGATDDKGQLFTHIKAVEGWLKAVGRLPVNVKFLIEGEEEVGSNNLDPFLKRQARMLRSDVAVISDTAQLGPNLPAITYGLRGIVACEVLMQGPKQDLHSGVFGGSIANPVNALASLLGLLHDARGRVTIPGFYDQVLPLGDAERARLAQLPFDEAACLKELGVAATWGEEGFTTLERRWVRPTCDVNGIQGGYQGEGPKTIIPSWAKAKITCRLVPHQNPAAIAKALEEYLRKNCRPGLRLEVKIWHGCNGFVLDPNTPYMAAAAAAIRQGFGIEPYFIREGGSIPVVASFKQLLQVDTLLLGWGRNTDGAHGPNEHFHLSDLHRGTLSAAHLLAHLAQPAG